MPAEKLEPVVEFQVGDHVLVQNMYPKAWDLRRQIAGSREGGRSFVVLIADVCYV